MGLSNFFNGDFSGKNVGSKYQFVEMGDKDGSWGCCLEQNYNNLTNRASGIEKKNQMYKKF